jgi:biopolymer transport protein ExbB/TolQ
MDFILGAGLLDTFKQADLQGKVIVLFLAVGSVVIWSVVAAKYSQLKHARASAQQFFSLYRKERDPLGLYLRGIQLRDCPIYRVYRVGCEQAAAQLALAEDSLAPSDSGVVVAQMTTARRDAIRAALDRAIDFELLKLQSQMSLLSTAVTGGPFLGLLGSAWGIMDVFGRIGEGGTVRISLVAPGIAAALLATVVGLLVAVPSLFSFNLFSAQIRAITVEMDHFASEFVSAIERTQPRN